MQADCPAAWSRPSSSCRFSAEPLVEILDTLSAYQLERLAGPHRCQGAVSKDEKLLNALATSAEQRATDFTSQGLATTAWALATVKWRDQKLLPALVTP